MLNKWTNKGTLDLGDLTRDQKMHFFSWLTDQWSTKHERYLGIIWLKPLSYDISQKSKTICPVFPPFNHSAYPFFFFFWTDSSLSKSLSKYNNYIRYNILWSCGHSSLLAFACYRDFNLFQHFGDSCHHRKKWPCIYSFKYRNNVLFIFVSSLLRTNNWGLGFTSFAVEINALGEALN